MRLLNKHRVYMDLLPQETIDAAIECLYTPTDAAKKAMPPTKTKAAAIDYCVGLARVHHQKDGSWFDADKMEGLLAGPLCGLPAIFKGIKEDQSFLHRTVMRQATYTMSTTYNDVYQKENFKCYKSHYLTFYSARDKSLIAAASQMVQFKITIDGFDYQSNEKYYQIQKLLTMKALIQEPRFASLKFAKCAKKPEEITDTE